MPLPLLLFQKFLYSISYTLVPQKVEFIELDKKIAGIIVPYSF